MNEYMAVKKALIRSLESVANRGVASAVSIYALIDTEDPSWPFDFRWVQKQGAQSREADLINERLFDTGFIDFGYKEVRSEDNLEGILYKGIEDMFNDEDCIGVAPVSFFDGSERVRMAHGIEEEDAEENPDTYRFTMFVNGVKGNIIGGEPSQQLDYEDVPRVLGLVIKYDADVDGQSMPVIAFQRIQPMWILKKSSFINFSREGGSEFFSDRSLKMGNNFDFVLLGDDAVFRTLKTLEGLFAFKKLMQNRAKEYAECLDHLVADYEKLEERILEAPTVASKLLKIQKSESPVVDMPAEEVANRVKRIAYYSGRINFNEEDKVILVTNQNVNNFLRMLSDDLVVSPLSGTRYEAKNKKRLDDTGIE